ncbi:hypothetical protein F4212_09040 [Candidatus Poribacteria bacterium]|nr:hypothetical protein [Candidatus Poribacteria bacterium]
MTEQRTLSLTDSAARDVILKIRAMEAHYDALRREMKNTPDEGPRKELMQRISDKGKELNTLKTALVRLPWSGNLAGLGLGR